MLQFGGLIVGGAYFRNFTVSWFVSGKQIKIIICRSRRLRQIIDLRDTDKSWYFAITEFNNNIVLSFDHWVCFLRNICGKRSNLPLSCKSNRKKEKSMVSFTHEQNSLCSQKQLNDIAHDHTIIYRQLFAGHVVCSRSMKRNKHLHRMIIKLSAD